MLFLTKCSPVLKYRLNRTVQNISDIYFLVLRRKIKIYSTRASHDVGLGSLKFIPFLDWTKDFHSLPVTVTKFKKRRKEIISADLRNTYPSPTSPPLLST